MPSIFTFCLTHPPPLIGDISPKKFFLAHSLMQVDEKGLAVGHIVTTMMENYTAHTGFHYRYGYNMEAFISTLDVGRYYHNEKGIGWWKMVQPYLTRFRSYLQVKAQTSIVH